MSESQKIDLSTEYSIDITEDNNDSEISDYEVSDSNLNEEDEEELDNEIDILNDDEKPDFVKNELLVPDNERSTIPILFHYEKVRLLGTRAKQISDGSKIFVKTKNVSSAMEIAELELKYKVLPIKIKRPLPDGRFEIWTVKELENLN